jgi:hypothetical protein
MSAGRILRDVRALLTHRQPALGYLVALSFGATALDVAVAASRHRLDTFSAFCRNEFDGVVVWRAIGALDESSALVWVAVSFAILASAALTGWLRPCFLIALGNGRYTLTPGRRTFVRFTVYSLLFEIVGLASIGLGDTGNEGIGQLILLVAVVATLYTDYAIALDDAGVVEGVRRSLRAFWKSLPISLLVTVLVLFVFALASVAFKRGFTDSTHVQPSYLVAWLLLADVLLQFLIDVVLLTLYRAIGFSAGGPGGLPAADPPPEAPD